MFNYLHTLFDQIILSLSGGDALAKGMVTVWLLSVLGYMCKKIPSNIWYFIKNLLDQNILSKLTLSGPNDFLAKLLIDVPVESIPANLGGQYTGMLLLLLLLLLVLVFVEYLFVSIFLTYLLICIPYSVLAVYFL